MTPAARSVRVFAINLALLAVALLLAPNLLLGAVGLPTTSEVWIRVVGMLVALLVRAGVWLAAAVATLLAWPSELLVGALGLLLLGVAALPGLAPRTPARRRANSIKAAS